LPFVKVDCDIVESSVWMPRDLRSLFLTALFMAKPHNLTAPTPQLKVRSNEPTGWTIPAGEYGIIPAAASRIIAKDGIDLDHGLVLLEELGSPDHESKDPEFDGRRIVRVTGGYLVLNFRKYRDKDYTAAKRQREWRQRQRKASTPEDSNGVITVTVTQAEAEAEVKNAAACTPPESTSPQLAPSGPDISDRTVSRSDAQTITVALNRGLADNVNLEGRYNPVVATSGNSHKAAEKLAAAGVPLSFARSWIYTLAVGYAPKKLGDQINSVQYVVPTVIEKWERERARIDAEQAERPQEPRSDDAPPSAAIGRNGRLNGKRDLKGEGIIIFGRLKYSVREQIVPNDPTEPGAGNYLVRTVDPAEIAKLDQAGQAALAAVGGAQKIARSSSDTDTLAWQFAAAYAAAAGAEQ
jgi:hypothetical protein